MKRGERGDKAPERDDKAPAAAGGNPLNETPAPTDEPWWHYTDWFEGLSFNEIMDRLTSSNSQRISSDFVVVPALVVAQWGAAGPGDRMAEYARELVDRSTEFNVAELARGFYEEMLRRDGYSTQHMDRAWAEARKFEQALRVSIQEGGEQHTMTEGE